MMKKDYAYAASYEDFVSLIEDCDDLEELRQIRQLISYKYKYLSTIHSFRLCRYNIATEVAQATAIGSMRRSKGSDPEQEFLLLGSNKIDLLQVI